MLKTTRSKNDDYRALVMAGVKSVLIVNNMNANTLKALDTLGMNVTYIHNNEVDNDAELGGYILEEVKKLAGQHFDLIISNPPYKKIGAEITYSIVKNVDWGTFINLLPANDYTRVKGLIGHVDLGTLTPILNAFEDAEVRTWVAKINKKPITITQDMFTLNTYDKKFQKFYAENMSRSHYAIDTFNMNPNVNSSDARVDWPVDKAFCITLRTAQDGVHRLEGKNIGFDVEFNVLGTKNFADVHAAGGVMWTCGFLYLETAVEKDNFVDFWYRGKLMNALIRGMNRSSGNVKPALPKVDWTRKWTDEQILKEFGYTAEEIADIMASL